MELHPLLIRIDPNIFAGMKALKPKKRMSIAAMAEEAFRDYLDKEGMQIKQVRVDVE